MEISKFSFVLLICIILLKCFIPVAAIDHRDQKYSKRSTMLLNRLMNALNKTYHHENMNVSQMDLHRRGEGKMYWKCYFNAVSCFRRK